MLYDNVKFSKRINKLFIMSTRDLIHYRADDAKIPSRYWPFCVILSIAVVIFGLCFVGSLRGLSGKIKSLV